VNTDELILAIIAEMERVWGGVCNFHGDNGDYQWLQENYGISEEDDVRWQLFLEYDADDLSEEDREDEELMAFLEDADAVEQFSQSMLARYRSSSAVSLKVTGTKKTA